MNRYWLFQEYEYETNGGLADLQFTFHTVEAAIEYVVDHRFGDTSHIIDSITWKSVGFCEHGFGSRYNNEPLVWEECGDFSYSKGEPDE